MLQRKLREVREFGVLSARSGSWQDVVYTLTTKRLTFILGFLHLPVTLRNFSETRFPGPSPVLQVRPGNQADRSEPSEKRYDSRKLNSLGFEVLGTEKEHRNYPVETRSSQKGTCFNKLSYVRYFFRIREQGDRDFDLFLFL